MSEPVVSVIVPIYKTEAYLDECIQSIVEQSYDNLEILLLDDGSPDNCPQISDQWAERDSRIRVVHKSNSGVSDTRNLGISLANGKYVTFVDSDDYLKTNAIQIMVAQAEKYQVQCVAGGYVRLLRNGSILEKPSTDQLQICNGKQEVEVHILYRLVGAEYKNMKPLSQSACVKLYDRQVLLDHNVKFLPIREIGSEDFYFNICFFQYAESVAIIPENLYVYRDNGESCSNTYDSTRLDSFIKLYRTMLEKDLFSDREKYLQMLTSNILGGISVCIKLLIASDIPDKVVQLSEVLNKKEICQMTQQCCLKDIHFPLSLFCMLMKYKMKYSLYFLISLFVKLNMEKH